MKKFWSLLKPIGALGILLSLLVIYQNCGYPLRLDESPSIPDNTASVIDPPPPPPPPPPEDPGKRQSTWQQMPIRTKAQAAAGLVGGEGFQQIWNIKYAPSNPLGNTIYLVTDTSRIWKSTDGGSTWQPKNNGISTNGGYNLAVDPNNENRVIALMNWMNPGESSGSRKGIYKSSDGGETWTMTRANRFGSRPSADALGGTAIAFASSSTVYLGTQGEGLLKSNDGGGTWAQVDLPALNGDTIYDLKLHPDDPNLLYVVSYTDNLIYRVALASKSVSTLGSNLPKRPNALVIIGNRNTNTNDDIIYALASEKGVYKSLNSGSSFSAINNGLEKALAASARANYLVISPSDPSYLYLSFSSNNHIYFSHDAGNSWVSPTSMDVLNNAGWVNGSQLGYDSGTWGNYYHSTLAVHPKNRDIALIMGDADMIKKTSDGGRTWVFSSSGYTGGAAGGRPQSSGVSPLSWDRQQPSRMAVFLTDFGAFLTEDGENTFRNLRIPWYQYQKTTLAGTLISGTNIIVTAIGSWGGQRIAITRNSNLESPDWDLLSGTDDYYSYIGEHPQNPNICYVGKYKFTNLQKDNSYTVLSKKVVAVYPKEGNIVYAAEKEGNNTLIFKSTDGGMNWSTPYPPVPVSSNVGQVTVDPNNNDRLYVAVAFRGIYRVTPSEISLINEANGLEKDSFGQLDTYFVQVDPKNSSILYAGSWVTYYGQSNGVFRSINGGATWQKITFNLGSDLTVTSLSLNPHNSHIYTGSYHGTWKLPPPTGL